MAPVPGLNEFWLRLSAVSCGRPLARSRVSVPAGLLLLLSSSFAQAQAYDDEPESSPDHAYDDDAPEPEPQRSDALSPPEPTPEEDAPLEAGGLAAPAAMGSNTAEATGIEEELAEADRRDSGRGLEFVWLAGSAGVTHTNLTGLSDSGLAPGAANEQTGFGWGVGAGVRLLYFTLGARLSMMSAAEFTQLSVLGEVAMKLPLGNLEPYAGLGLGYAGASGLSAPGLANDVSVGGLSTRLLVGADYYLGDNFSVGALVSWDLLALSRAALSAAEVGSGDSAYLVDGSALGNQISAGAVVGFHF